MAVKTFDTRTYSINDFLEWSERGHLELQPKFQRRSVWNDKARSFLMDTIVRGKPIPKIFIRQRTDPRDRLTIREVVDGQQRLRTILSFVNNGFSMSRTHNSEFGGQTFSALPPELQRSILEYEISVDLLLGADDREVLDVFARLNSYAIVLNSQERLNAEFFGEFKQTVYELAQEYLTLWQSFNFMSERAILRMDEAQFTSEILIAIVEGIRSRKAIKQTYERYDDQFPGKQQVVDRYKRTMDLVGEIFADETSSIFRDRAPALYSLICAVYHANYGIDNVATRRVPLRRQDLSRIRAELEQFDRIFVEDERKLSEPEVQFKRDVRLATTDQSVRVRACEFVSERLSAYVASA